MACVVAASSDFHGSRMVSDFMEFDDEEYDIDGYEVFDASDYTPADEESWYSSLAVRLACAALSDDHAEGEGESQHLMDAVVAEIAHTAVANAMIQQEAAQLVDDAHIAEGDGQCVVQGTSGAGAAQPCLRVERVFEQVCGLLDDAFRVIPGETGAAIAAGREEEGGIAAVAPSSSSSPPLPDSPASPVLPESSEVENVRPTSRSSASREAVPGEFDNFGFSSGGALSLRNARSVLRGDASELSATPLAGPAKLGRSAVSGRPRSAPRSSKRASGEVGARKHKSSATAPLPIPPKPIAATQPLAPQVPPHQLFAGAQSSAMELDLGAACSPPPATRPMSRSSSMGAIGFVAPGRGHVTRLPTISTKSLPAISKKTSANWPTAGGRDGLGRAVLGLPSSKARWGSMSVSMSAPVL